MKTYTDPKGLVDRGVADSRFLMTEAYVVEARKLTQASFNRMAGESQ